MSKVRRPSLFQRIQPRTAKTPAAGQGVRAGVAWYAAAEWQRLREIAADPEKLEETHAEWERIAQKRMAEMAARGMLLERVDVRIDDLEAWCREHGQPVDANARAAYATELLRRKAEGIDR